MPALRPRPHRVVHCKRGNCMTLRRGEYSVVKSAPAGRSPKNSLWNRHTAPGSHWPHMRSYRILYPVMAKQKLTSKEREERRSNWLAPAGSLQERRFLKKLLVQPGLSNEDRMLLDEWIAKPDGFEKRNALFWHAAKRQILGPVVSGIAIERHKRLRSDEWLVACLIAEGLNQK